MSQQRPDWGEAEGKRGAPLLGPCRAGSSPAREPPTVFAPWALSGLMKSCPTLLTRLVPYGNTHVISRVPRVRNLLCACRVLRSGSHQAELKVSARPPLSCSSGSPPICIPRCWQKSFLELVGLRPRESQSPPSGFPDPQAVQEKAVSFLP